MHTVPYRIMKRRESEVWEQKCGRLFYYFDFEKNLDIANSKSPYFLLNKNIEKGKGFTLLERWN